MHFAAARPSVLDAVKEDNNESTYELPRPFLLSAFKMEILLDLPLIRPYSFTYMLYIRAI